MSQENNENLFITLFVYILLKNSDILLLYSYRICNHLYNTLYNYIFRITKLQNISMIKDDNNIYTKKDIIVIDQDFKLNEKLDQILEESIEELMIEHSKNKLISQQNILLDMMEHNPDKLIDLIPDENKKSFSTILNNPLTKKIFQNEKLKKRFIDSIK